MVSIMDVTDEAFIKAVREAKGMEKNGYYDQISEDRDDYAGDMSYVFIHDDEISSMVLCERLPNEDLHIVMLMAFNPDGAKELLKLLHYTASYYFFNYPVETTVHLTLGTERSMNLATHLFPDVDPIEIRRGYFS